MTIALLTDELRLPIWAAIALAGAFAAAVGFLNGLVVD